MTHDVEEVLTRELHQMAEAVDVPVLPTLPADPPRQPGWRPVLVAAAVLVVVLGAVAGVLGLADGDRVQPAPSPSPTPTAGTEDPAEIPTTAPSVPYVLESRLFVAGRRVPGAWASVQGADDGWVGVRLDGTYWWGYDAQPRRLEGAMAQPPALSPSGRYLARIVEQGGRGMLIGADTLPAGEGFGGVPVDLVDRDGVYTSVAAVTDDGLVVTRGRGVSLLWRPLVDGQTVDLARTAPDQVVLGNTEAGLLVVDGSEGAVLGNEGDPYLAEISADGEITPITRVPNHDDLVASERWLTWAPPGSLGGEVGAIEQLDVQRVDGTGQGTLRPPEGWAFQVGTWTWEDDDHLVAAVIGDSGARMVRCSPAAGRCVLVEAS